MYLLLWRCLYKKHNVITNTDLIQHSFPFTRTLINQQDQRTPTSQYEKLPNNYYDDINNQKTFVDDAAKLLKITHADDWYTVTWKNFVDIGGSSLLNKYSNSLQQLLSAVYPDHEWLPWRFSKVPPNFWEDPKNHRKFLDWASHSLNIKNYEDWYKVSVKDIQDLGGRALLLRYKDSPSAMLSAVFLEHTWLEWKFEQTPKHFWESGKNRRKFLEWASNELNIKEPSDWYKVTSQNLINLGGKPLLKEFNYSLTNLLSFEFPDFKWQKYKFIGATSPQWDEILKDKLQYISYLEKELGISSGNEWNNVTKNELNKVKIPRGASLKDILSLAQEVHQTASILQSKSPSYKKTQGTLKSMLQAICPRGDVLEEYKHPDIYSSHGVPLELDYFYPDLKLAIEYQGQQHYAVTLHYHTLESLQERREKDLRKVKLCADKGITLVQIPYWWDRTYESLAATIYSRRPDLFPDQIPQADPIPTEEPTKAEQKQLSNNMKGKLMTATNWEDDKDPTGWWMTEKFDGMRLYWTGSQFLTRTGTKIKVPESVTQSMPRFALDGELWTQYGLYQGAVNLARTDDESRWKNAILWVFDAPDINNKPYEERIEFLKKQQQEGKLSDLVKVIEVTRCQSREHLKQFFDQVLNKGGEGVMLREPQSLYKAGRFTGLRKYKPFLDAEVKVVESLYPHGFNCIQANGKKLFVGISENYEEAKKVEEGAVITVKYAGANANGTYMFPKFYRERNDVSWNELINL